MAVNLIELPDSGSLYSFLQVIYYPVASPIKFIWIDNYKKDKSKEISG